MGPGFFRNVAGPWARGLGRGARVGLRGSKGFANIRSNIGFGFSALKGDPKTVMGFGQLQALGRQGRALRPGNVMGLGREMGYGLRRWGTAADLTGQGRLRGVALGARAGGVGVGVAGADFLNPWGIGFGD